MCNLRTEGILTARSLLPSEFAEYRFDELQYLRETLAELTRRQSLGVDVSADRHDLMQFLAKRSHNLESLTAVTATEGSIRRRTLWQRIRTTIGDRGARRLRNWIKAPRKSAQSDFHARFRLSGADSGFQDILGCAALLARALSAPQTLSVRSTRSLRNE